jgi:3-deoxy-manno-octulosonate cytidylyltransferase (CMP-KDO synthetase)
MATLATPIRDRAQLEDPACVKVVCSDQGDALYFSRSPIPFPRDGWRDAWFESPPYPYHQHIGLYAYRRDFLLQLAELPPTPLEQMEKLEQLRVLAAGFPIAVGIVDSASRGIDTADDYRAFVRRRRNC